MAIKIGHASIDERGKATGGVAGDQKKEVCTRTWYNGGWNVVLRPKNATLAEKSAKACEAACKNNKIGYDQNGRNTLYAQAKAVGFDLSKIKVACECDCSSLMHVCAIVGGAKLTYGSNGYTTRTMRNAFAKSGDYEVLTASKYLTSDKYLKRGDILVKEGSHTVMVLENGSEVVKAMQTVNTTTSNVKVESAKYFDKNKSKTYTTTADLHLRSGADASKTSLLVIPKGKTVRCYGYYSKASNGTEWYYVVYNGTNGFCSSKYLQ